MSVSQGVDGKYLVIADKTALPQRCVRTNVPVDSTEYTSWDIAYQSNRLLSFLLLGFPALLFGSYAAQTRCRFKAGLSRNIRRRFILFQVAAYGTIALSPCVFVAGVALQDEMLVTYSIIACPFLIFAALVFLALFTSPLKVARMEEERFWIEGCSQEFLDSLRAPTPTHQKSAE